MEENREIVNRVESSGLLSFDLEDYYDKGERVVYDLKNNLYMELILKEKDFRDFIKSNNWSDYKGKNVAVICSVDAVIPTWAYMLLISKLQPFANNVVVGDLEALEQSMFQKALSAIDINEFIDKKVVIKGCGNYPVPEYAYGEITRRLLPVVSSIMYGEPCSTVPVYKKPKS
jgi:hypothetical protein